MRYLYLVQLVVFCFLINTFSAVAQQKQTPHEPAGYWVGYFGDNKLNKKIGIHSEAQVRNAGLSHTVETYLLRTGLNFYINPQTMVTAGYAFVHNQPSSEKVIGSKVTENRIWQQLILRQRSRNIFLEHRFRLEQRFLENRTAHTSQVDHRVRYRFQTMFPLYSISPHLRHYFVSVNNEVFINFKQDASRIFDRNRFYAGFGYQVSPKMNFQLGYLNQLVNMPASNKAVSDHIVQFGTSYNMDDLMQTFFNKR